MPGVCAGMSGVTSWSPRLIFGISSPFRGLCHVRPAGRARASVERFEEPVDLEPDILAAGEPAPPRPNDRHEAVAILDRDEPVPPSSLDAVDEQRLDIRLHRREHRSGRLDL